MEGWLCGLRSPLTSAELEGLSLFPGQHTDGRQPEPQQFLPESFPLRVKSAQEVESLEPGVLLATCGGASSVRFLVVLSCLVIFWS